MMLKKYLFIALASSLSICTTADAQSEKKTVRFDKPLPLILDLETGAIIPGDHQNVATPVPDFSNVDLGGFVGVDSGAGSIKWVDKAIKGPGNASNQMQQFSFTYCSSAQDPSLGGEGASMTIEFYDSYTIGGPLPAQPIATYVFTGLPAHTEYSAPFAARGAYSIGTPGMTCYSMTVLLPAPVQFADGDIAYSWTFDDVNSDGIMAATVPALACVQGCLGAGPDAQGMVDKIDRYFAPGTFDQTLIFTPPTGFATSMSMEIEEIADCTATTVTYNSTSPPCVDVWTSYAPFVIGQTTTLTVEHRSNDLTPIPAVASTLLVRGSMIPGNGAAAGVSGGESRGRLLVNGAFIANIASTSSAGPFRRSFAIPLPLQFGVVCEEWYAQALTLGGAKQKLSEGLIINTGTQ